MLVASKEHMDSISPVIFVAAMCVSDLRCKNPVGNMDRCIETTAGLARLGWAVKQRHQSYGEIGTV